MAPCAVASPLADVVPNGFPKLSPPVVVAAAGVVPRLPPKVNAGFGGSVVAGTAVAGVAGLDAESAAGVLLLLLEFAAIFVPDVLVLASVAVAPVDVDGLLASPAGFSSAFSLLEAAANEKGEDVDAPPVAPAVDNPNENDGFEARDVFDEEAATGAAEEAAVFAAPKLRENAGVVPSVFGGARLPNKPAGLVLTGAASVEVLAGSVLSFLAASVSFSLFAAAAAAPVDAVGAGGGTTAAATLGFASVLPPLRAAARLGVEDDAPPKSGGLAVELSPPALGFAALKLNENVDALLGTVLTELDAVSLRGS